MTRLFPCCPGCNQSLPLRNTQWNLGKPFACRSCGTRLVIERNYWLPAAAIVAFYAGRVRWGDGVQLIYLFLAIVAALLVIQFATMKPQVVDTKAG